MNYSILLTFDVEDWFQVENFKQCIPFSSWPNCELRVEKNVHRILDLLDSIELNNPANLKNVSRESASRKGLTHNSKPATRNNGFEFSPDASRLTPHGKSSPKATFFVLGWLAEHLPHLIREIQTRGHEVASHGYYHKLCREQSTNELRVDLVKSKELLEDVTGNPVYGYRAPSFSINHDILKIIEECRYLYDSSLNSFRLNTRYGQVDLGTNNGSNGLSIQISDRFYELPISNLRIGKQTIPWGGGGYFRLIPVGLFKLGVRSILKKHGGYIFYMHPWEIDSDQPKMSEIQLSYKLRHYINISKTLDKLSYLLKKLKNCQFPTCYQYLKEVAAVQHCSTATPTLNNSFTQ